MMDFLASVERWPISVFVRESDSLLAYPFVLTMHTIGLALLMGVSFALDLRLLGWGAEAPTAPYAGYMRFLWFGFWLNAVSGVILLLADATTKLINPVFYVKMGFIVLAMWNVRAATRALFQNGTPPPNARLLAWSSIGFWIGATASGRMMAYLGPVAGLR